MNQGFMNIIGIIYLIGFVSFLLVFIKEGIGGWKDGGCGRSAFITSIFISAVWPVTLFFIGFIEIIEFFHRQRELLRN